MVIFPNWKCPCDDCKFYEYRNGYHYCTRKKLTIVQHKGNLYHNTGRWIIPCGRDFYLYQPKLTDFETMEGGTDE